MAVEPVKLKLTMKKTYKLAVCAVALATGGLMTGCENRAVQGAGIGAAGGAIVGGLIGGDVRGAATGAAIGAGAGAIGGAIVHENEQRRRGYYY